LILNTRTRARRRSTRFTQQKKSGLFLFQRLSTPPVSGETSSRSTSVVLDLLDLLDKTCRKI